MRFVSTIILILSLQGNSYSQETYTMRKGSRLFPGHLEAQITIDNETLRYELFNHWYSWSYAELRQITIPLDSLETFNSINDSLSIQILDNKLKLLDKKYKLNKKVKHQKLCVPVEFMRKISYAYSVSSKYDTISHFELYEREDLKLSEDEFKKIIHENLSDKIR